MNLPKTILLCGKTYTIVKDKHNFDSGGTTIDQKITVGVESKKAERHFENLVHEIMEIIACERSVRYGHGVSERSIFFMTHKEFDNFSVDVAAALMPMIRS